MWRFYDNHILQDNHIFPDMWRFYDNHILHDKHAYPILNFLEQF